MHIPKNEVFKEGDRGLRAGPPPAYGRTPRGPWAPVGIISKIPEISR